MTTRYVTEGEKAGVKRRSAEYRQRLRDAGLKPSEVWASQAEHGRIKSILATWRGTPSDLNEDEIKAANKLKPREPDAA